MTENSTNIFEFVILRHFGLICLILTIFFTGVQKLYSLIRVRKYPELKDGYRTIILGYLIFMGILWLIIAIGEIVYGFSGILFLLSFNVNSLLSWFVYLVIFCELIFLLVWVWFKDGGEYLYKYQLLFYNFSSPLVAKLFVTILSLGGTIIFAFLVITNL
ncbi:MAG: hypothetical protein JNK81_16040 [Anaerolineales bacterium]|nr:hypothetical protein [Anaerolineales bacterium]